MASRSPEIPLSGGAGVYQFTKAMDTLGAGLDDKTWLILSTDSDLLRYLKGPERKEVGGAGPRRAVAQG